MKKRMLIATLFVAMGAVVFAGGSTEQRGSSTAAGSQDFRMGVLFAGLTNDGGFNEVGYEAIQNAEQNLGVTVNYVESVRAADSAAMMGDYAELGFDLVYAWSGSYQSTVFQVAPRYRDTSFVAFAGPQMTATAPANVWISGNAFEDAFFLAGALAGLMTRSNVVAYLGGVEIPVYKASGIAFEEGAKFTNPNVQFYSTFVGDFNDPTAAREGIRGLIETGADIILAGVNAGIFGAIPPARDAGVQLIGMSKDQYDLAPNTFLTSIVKDYGGVMAHIIERVRAGEPGGYAGLSLVDGSVWLAPYRGAVPANVEQRIEQIKQQLINGEIDFTTAGDL